MDQRKHYTVYSNRTEAKKKKRITAIHSRQNELEESQKPRKALVSSKHTVVQRSACRSGGGEHHL